MLSEIEAERSSLHAEVKAWRDDQALYMADVLDAISDATLIEEEKLLLPSELALTYRKAIWFEQLSKYERDLRKGMADDALAALRRALNYRDHLAEKKRKVVHGNKNNTRATVLIKRASNLIGLKANVYRRARLAMLSLGLSESDKTYAELKEEDVVSKNKATYPERGSSKTTDSWIWTIGPRGDLSKKEEDEWEEDGSSSIHSPLILSDASATKDNRVEWFRARHEMTQWKEEIEILDAELQRTAAWFATMSDLWKTLADSDISPKLGYSPYAYQKSDMHARRSAEAKNLHNWAKTAEIKLPKSKTNTKGAYDSLLPLHISLLI